MADEETIISAAYGVTSSRQPFVRPAIFPSTDFFIHRRKCCIPLLPPFLIFYFVPTFYFLASVEARTQTSVGLLGRIHALTNQFVELLCYVTVFLFS